jgi:hypothetical protein
VQGHTFIYGGQKPALFPSLYMSESNQKFEVTAVLDKKDKSDACLEVVMFKINSH